MLKKMELIDKPLSEKKNNNIKKQEILSRY